MSDSNLTFYDLLGVSPQATPAEIEGAYRALLIKVHPDISRLDNLDTHRLMAAVNEAWLTLKDPDKRTAYDESLTDLTKKPPSQIPTQSYLLEDVTDRGKSYVDQLDKFRAHWETERKKAEEERVERERLALAAQEARDSAWRVRRTIEQSVRDRVEPQTSVAWQVWLGAGAAVILTAASVWLLWPRQTPQRVRAGTGDNFGRACANALQSSCEPACYAGNRDHARDHDTSGRGGSCAATACYSNAECGANCSPTPKPRLHVNAPAVIPPPSAQPPHQARELSRGARDERERTDRRDERGLLPRRRSDDATNHSRMERGGFDHDLSADRTGWLAERYHRQRRPRHRAGSAA